MEDRRKNIRFVGMKPRRSLIRFVAGQVEKWINREQSLLFLPKVSNYKVTVEREEEHPNIHCDIEIRIGSKQWHGFETGRSLNDALTRALGHLRPVMTIARQNIESNATTIESHQVA